jgi:hypothetical protein
MYPLVHLKFELSRILPSVIGKAFLTLRLVSPSNDLVST